MSFRKKNQTALEILVLMRFLQGNASRGILGNKNERTK